MNQIKHSYAETTANNIRQLEKVAINDALPFKATRCDAVTKLKSFWDFESELQTNPMPFHLDSPCN